MEEQKAKENGIEFYSVPVIKFSRKNMLKNLSIPFVLFKSKKQVNKILRDNQVNCVFSKGGYASVPVMLAAQSQGIKTFLHESDMSMGLANKLSSKKSTHTFVSTEKAFSLLPEKIKQKASVIGLPVKSEFGNICKSKAREILKLPSSKKIILITGGSLGAIALNNIIFESIEELCTNYFVVHIVGKGKENKNIKHPCYIQLEFTDKMAEYFASSDLIISRAGATTIFEGIKSLTPMLLIPLPKGASRGDQVENAKYFEREKLASFLLQDNLTKSSLLDAINHTLKLGVRYKINMQKFCSKIPSHEKIVRQIIKMTYDD